MPTSAARGRGRGLQPQPAAAAGTGFERWLEALDAAITAVRAFRTDALVVPLGLDTFEGDPISGFRLKSADYPARRRTPRVAGAAHGVLFRGVGYAVAEVGVNAVNVLEGRTRLNQPGSVHALGAAHQRHEAGYVDVAARSVTPTRLPAKRSRCCISAASAQAPEGSSTSFNARRRSASPPPPPGRAR